ncbi:MAG: glycosyltransferase family 2 protein [Polyangiales bacterium]
MHSASEALRPRPKLSIVSPVYLGEALVERLVEEMVAGASGVTSDFEIVLVDDGSPDRSWEVIEEVCRKDPRVCGVRLSRNFGQHNALTAALEVAQGEYVVVMDCDLQDDPRYIPDLFAKIQEGYDVVYTLKSSRAHTSIRNVLGKGFHRVLSLLSKPSLGSDSRIGNYTMLRRPVVDAFLEIGDFHRTYLVLLRYLGFRSTTLEIEHRERTGSSSSYTLGRLFREAINAITAQSNRLLHASIALGFSFMALSFASVLVLVLLYYLNGFREGWASVVALQLLSTGLVLLSLGVVGIYVGKIFEQAKGRPPYVIMTKRNYARHAGDQHPIRDDEITRPGSIPPNVAE